MKYVTQHGGNPRNLVLEGQEANYGQDNRGDS
jgi:hypothetical protein